MKDNMTISELWYSENERDWINALNKYDEKVDSDLETYMNNITPEKVKTMEFEQFYEFLEKYYVWKYQNNYPKQRKNDLEKHKSGEGKKRLWEIHEEIFDDKNDITDIKKMITIVKKISGLGVAGASGLLSILYPEYYGTVDKFLVISLCLVDGFDKHDELLKIDVSDIKIDKAKYLEEIIRDKSEKLNEKFKPKKENKWTPKKIDKVLWAYRGNEQQIAYYEIEKAIVVNGAGLSKEQRKRLAERIMEI